jgi:hypothetical protein
VTLPDLQSCLVRLGVTLSARGDKLHFKAPAGALTPQIKDALAFHKAALMGLLTPAEAAPPAPPSGPPPAEPSVMVESAPRSSEVTPERPAVTTAVPPIRHGGPRDVRRGDRWLPWHFTPEFEARMGASHPKN